MKNLIIKVSSGLNNKLLPLLSLLRIAYKYNYNIKCFWTNICMGSVKVDEGYHFLDFFKPIVKIEFINKDEFSKLEQTNNLIIHHVKGHSHDYYRDASIIDNIEKSHIFLNVCHTISLKDDNMSQKLVPTPRKSINSCIFIEELRHYINFLKPKDDILNKINNIKDKFNNIKVLGFHIRTANPKLSSDPWSHVNIKKAITYLNNFIKDYPDWYIYLSADCKDYEDSIINKFKDKIIVFDNPFGKHYQDKFNINSHNGIKNGICEMFIISNCNKIVGTTRSSFSFMSWLLSSHDCLEHFC